MKLKRSPLYIGVFIGLILAVAGVTILFDEIPQGFVGRIGVIAIILVVVLEIFMYVMNRPKK